MNGVYYGYYSKAAVADGHASAIYKTEHGTEVEVTLVTRAEHGTSYEWADKKCVGRVIEFVRPGKPERVLHDTYLLCAIRNKY